MRSIIPSVVIPCLVVSLAAPPCVLELVLDGQRYEVDVSGYDRSAEETAGRLVQKLNLTGVGGHADFGISFKYELLDTVTPPPRPSLARRPYVSPSSGGVRG